MASKRLTALDAEDYVHIARSYQVKISGVAGTTNGRLIFLLSFCLVMALCFLVIMRFAYHDPFSALLGYFGFLLILGGCGGLQAFFVNVPKLTALLTTSITGTVHVQVPKLGVKYPWESHQEHDLISTRAYTLKKTSTFLTKDGVKVTYSWSMTISPFLPLLLLFVRTEHDTIVTGFIEVAESALSAIIKSKTADELRANGIDEDISKLLDRKLRSLKDEMGNTTEERFGASMEQPTLGPPLFGEDYNEAMMARIVRMLVQEDTVKLAEALGIPKSEALNMIAILNKEKVEKKIVQMELGEFATGALGKMNLDVGKLVDALENARNRKGKGKGDNGGKRNDQTPKDS